MDFEKEKQRLLRAARKVVGFEIGATDAAIRALYAKAGESPKARRALFLRACDYRSAKGHVTQKSVLQAARAMMTGGGAFTNLLRKRDTSGRKYVEIGDPINDDDNYLKQLKTNDDGFTKYFSKIEPDIKPVVERKNERVDCFKQFNAIIENEKDLNKPLSMNDKICDHAVNKLYQDRVLSVFNKMQTSFNIFDSRNHVLVNGTFQIDFITRSTLRKVLHLAGYFAGYKYRSLANVLKEDPDIYVYKHFNSVITIGCCFDDRIPKTFIHKNGKQRYEGKIYSVHDPNLKIFKALIGSLIFKKPTDDITKEHVCMHLPDMSEVGTDVEKLSLLISNAKLMKAMYELFTSLRQFELYVVDPNTHSIGGWYRSTYLDKHEIPHTSREFKETIIKYINVLKLEEICKQNMITLLNLWYTEDDIHIDFKDPSFISDIFKHPQLSPPYS